MSDASSCSTAQNPTQQEKAGTRLPIRRRLSQLFLLALLGQWSFYGIFRCPFLVPYISCQNCPVITCHGRLVSMFWGFWLVLPAVALLFGRAFCSWGCPGGLINQIFAKLAPCKLSTRNTLTRLAPAGKYLGLAAALFCYYLLGQPRADVPIRIGEFFQSVLLTFEHADLSWLIRTFFVLGMLGAGLIVANVWCRFACPSGGLLEMARPLALFRFYKTEGCNDCNRCLDICDMATRPDETNCTNCGDCREICPNGAILFGRKKSR